LAKIYNQLVKKMKQSDFSDRTQCGQL